MKSVHEPIRECISCGRKFPKKSLVRMVKNELGIFADKTGKQNGRGAYLCSDPACLDKLIRQKRLNRAFRQPIDDSVYRAIARALQPEQAESSNPAKQKTTEA